MCLAQRPRRSDAGEVRIPGPSASSQALFHWTTVLQSLLRNRILSFFTLLYLSPPSLSNIPGHIAQSVACLATDTSLTANPGAFRLIPARSHTFVEIDHWIINMAILLPSAESCKKGCFQLLTKICARSTGWRLFQACPGKSVVRWTDCPTMTLAVDLGCKASKQTNRKLLATGLHHSLLYHFCIFLF